MSRELTEEELAEVDRIIESTEIQTGYIDRDEFDNSIEGDVAYSALREAARRVRAYLKTLK